VAAEGGRVGAIAQRSINCFEHTREIVIDIAVPESQDTEARFAKPFVAVCIARAMDFETVLSAVDLDHETMLETNKIDDEILARCLSAEMVTPLSPRAKMNPYLHLLRRRRLAQASRDLVRHLAPAAISPHPARFARHPPPSGEGLDRFIFD
jgi:hypothetical protein